jgi:hypothetical protein
MDGILPLAVRTHAMSVPDKTFLVQAKDGKRQSYGETHEIALRLAKGLAA